MMGKKPRGGITGTLFPSVCYEITQSEVHSRWRLVVLDVRRSVSGGRGGLFLCRKSSWRGIRLSYVDNVCTVISGDLALLTHRQRKMSLDIFQRHSSFWFHVFSSEENSKPAAQQSSSYVHKRKGFTRSKPKDLLNWVLGKSRDGICTTSTLLWKKYGMFTLKKRHHWTVIVLDVFIWRIF